MEPTCKSCGRSRYCGALIRLARTGEAICWVCVLTFAPVLATERGYVGVYPGAVFDYEP